MRGIIPRSCPALRTGPARIVCSRPPPVWSHRSLPWRSCTQDRSSVATLSPLTGLTGHNRSQQSWWLISARGKATAYGSGCEVSEDKEGGGMMGGLYRNVSLTFQEL